jgi:Xaa-Pro aminopeptidase
MAVWNRSDPKYLMGHSVDYEERINWERIRKERLGKLQKSMRSHDFGALLLYWPGNIRYATGTRWLTAFTNIEFLRCALVPAEGQPILYELMGVESEVRSFSTPWVVDHMRPHIAWNYTGAGLPSMIDHWAREIQQGLKDLGASGTRLGVDRVDPAMVQALTSKGIHWFDGRDCIYDAQMIKTVDEIELYKIGCAVTDACLDRAKEAIRPGVRESEIMAVIADTGYRLGMEFMQATVVASGGHTNPYNREFTDKMIRSGDLVILDVDLAADGGYVCDYVRVFLCGEKATPKQKALYNECYESLYSAITMVKDGVTTDKIAAHFPEYVDDKLKSFSLLQLGHGLGPVFYLPPIISRGVSFEYPMELKENMIIALETYAGPPGEAEGVRLEENLLVTKDGFEYLSLYPLEPKLTDKTQPKTAADILVRSRKGGKQ